MKHAKLEIMARIKRFKDDNSNGVFTVCYGAGCIDAVSVTPAGAANIELTTKAGDIIIMNANDMVWVKFSQPKATCNLSSGGTSRSQQEMNGEFNMKYIKYHIVESEDHYSIHAASRQKVILNSKRKRVKALPEDFEYAH